MKTLLFAAILYLLGIIIILLLRPRLMFDEDGKWKEFGMVAGDHTLFPFWLFCITWAALSYCVTLVFVNDAPIAAMATTAGLLRQIEPPEDLVHPLPSKKKSKAKESPHGDMKPGYYILDANELKKTGVPKYIYIGTNNSEPVAVDRERSDSE